MDIRAAAFADIPRLLELINRYWEFEGIGGFEQARIEPVLKQLLSNLYRRHGYTERSGYELLDKRL